MCYNLPERRRSVEIIEEEKKLAEARSRFASLLGSVKNAVIIKSERNGFAVTAKFPLLIFACLLIIASMVTASVVVNPPDAIIITASVAASLGLVFIIALLTRTFFAVRKNARESERLFYQNKGGEATIVTLVRGGGRKAEWKDASLYFAPDGSCEIIESPDVEYKPFLAKNYRGHSRGFRLLQPDFLLKTFFNGCEVLEDKDGRVALSSGFSFSYVGDTLTSFTIEGFFSECYENNFPIGSVLSESKSYKFSYAFTAVNDPGFIQRFPPETKAAAKVFGLSLPSGVVILDSGDSYSKA